MTGEIRFTNPDIFIDKNGVWFANGNKVIHKKIFRLFCDSLVYNDDSGYMLRIGDEECPVRVEDAPFIAHRILSDADNSLKIVLNEGTVEPFHPETLTRRGDTALYCRIRNGQIKVRIGRSAYPDIITNIIFDEKTGVYSFRHAEKAFPINEE